MTRIIFILAIVSILVVSADAQAEWRCDCTQVTGSCRGTVVVEGNGISVGSDSQQCSRVDYFVDGQPFVTVAVDGKAKEAWLSGTEKSKILVQSCQVCADSLHKSNSVSTVESAAPLLGSETSESLNNYLPVVTFAPVYPEAALASGLEGYVIIKTIVGESGRVQGVRVVESKPSRVFDNAALATVRRWRYSPRAPGDPDVETLERVTFSLGNRQASTNTNRAPQITTTGGPGSLNRCVREADVLRQRNRHEIQVRNVCSEPLIVYSCSEGVGADQGRWNCNSVSDQGTILVEEGDSRAGRSMSQYTERGGSTKFLYAERHSIYTATTDRYWWIACGFGDTECRASGRRWRDSLHNRPTQITPNTKLAKVSRSR